MISDAFTQFRIALIEGWGGTAVTVRVQDGNYLAARAILVKYPRTRSFLVTDVFVYKRFRGQGYGHLLMERIIDYAYRKKRDLMLQVNPKNTKAISLYTKCGFEPFGEISKKLVYKWTRTKFTNQPNVV